MNSNKEIFYITTMIILFLILVLREYTSSEKLKRINESLLISKYKVELLKNTKISLEDSINNRNKEIDSLLIIVNNIPDIDSLYAYNKKNHDKNINNIRKLNADSSLKLFTEWTSKLNQTTD